MKLRNSFVTGYITTTPMPSDFPVFGSRVIAPAHWANIWTIREFTMRVNYTMSHIWIRHPDFLMLWNRAKDLLRRTARFLDPRPRYFEVQQMDCDCYVGTTAIKIKHGWLVKRTLDRIRYENTEGPTCFFEISKRDYDRFLPSGRDAALEAFENGHSHTVYF